MLDVGQRPRIDARRTAVLLDPSPRFPQDVTPVDAVQHCMETTARLPLGRTPESTLQLAHFVARLASRGVVGSGHAGHALARACAVDVAPAGTLGSARVVRRGPPHYYGPLGFPLRRARFRRWLIRATLPRLGPRRRASRVSFRSVSACCAPYPTETWRAYASGLERPRTWPSPRHDRLGSRIVNVSRLQASRDVAARGLAPSVEALDTPLGPRESPRASWGLLLGAPALTEAGLAPAGEERRDDSARALSSSRRTMPLILLAPRPCTSPPRARIPPRPGYPRRSPRRSRRGRPARA